MPNLLVARTPKRKGLLVARGLQSSPTLLFPLEGTDKQELDHLVRAILAKGGITEESEVQAVIEKAEQDYEIRIHIAETRKEVRRLLAMRWAGAKIMQRGFRHWVQVFHPPVKEFKK